VFHGYYPKWNATREFQTEDNGQMDVHGHLQVLGRRDAVIISGGKKVQPAEIEAVLRASGEFSDVAVVGVADVEWGQVVVACYPTGGPAPDLARAVIGLEGANKPKRFVAIPRWPRNAQGKIDRVALARELRSAPVEASA
jgi:O-succinylbenzoic acid--CoA ligase